MIEIEMRLFGSFRKYEKHGNPIILNASEPISVSNLKERLNNRFKELFPHFSDSELIQDSAIASDSQVLDLNHVIKNSCSLLILPPVCGG